MVTMALLKLECKKAKVNFTHWYWHNFHSKKSEEKNLSIKKTSNLDTPRGQVLV